MTHILSTSTHVVIYDDDIVMEGTEQECWDFINTHTNFYDYYVTPIKSWK